MAEVLLFHHVCGLTAGVESFAGALRADGHVVHVPDLFDGRVFDSVEDGAAFVESAGFDAVVARAVATAATLPSRLVYAGFSLGVVAAQRLAQTRPGAAGALLIHACVPYEVFGREWPRSVPVQVHGMDRDPFFTGEGDLDAARALVAAVASPDAELFTYPGSGHLFADDSLGDFDPEATRLLHARVTAFLTRVDGG